MLRTFPPKGIDLPIVLEDETVISHGSEFLAYSNRH